MRTLGICAIALTLGQSHAAFAQLTAAQERAEVAARLRSFEAAWENADAAGHARALQILPKASTQFLALNLKESGRTLDLARYALGHEGEPNADWKWANSFAVTVGPRLLGTESGPDFVSSVQKFYPVERQNISIIRLLIGDGRGNILTKLTCVPNAFPPCEIRVPEPLGDFGCSVELVSDVRGRKPALINELLTPARLIGGLAVPNLAARLKALEAPPKTLPPLEAASLADYHALLAQFAKGEPTDTQWLTPKLALETAEAIRRDTPGGTFRASPGVACEFWLTVPTAGAKTQCRVQIPAVPAGQKVPVVVALHGVGGSEHMFPEAYGAGCLAKAARDAGFALVCPRGGLFGPPPVPEILAELATRFPIDTTKVHLVGHSLGASQAAELAQRSGQRPETVALLAGGGRVRDAEKLRATRLFLAVGDADFAARSTRKFRDALKAAGVEPQFKEYPGVEHLTIVRVAIDDVAKHWRKK